MQNWSKSIENYCFKNKNIVGFRGALPVTLHRGLCPLDLRWGLRLQTPVVGSLSVLAMCVLLKKSLE